MTELRLYFLTALLSIPFALFSQCPTGEIPDCNGNCYPASWVGDGVCDDGIQFQSDFMCQQFNWDNGDCDNCPPGMVADCNGTCWPTTYIGNGVCNSGAAGGPNYNCAVFDYDGGDCPFLGCTDPLATNFDPNAQANDGSCYYTPCPPSEFADCNGTCWPNALLDYLGDWHCHQQMWVTNNTYFNFGPLALDLNCEMFNFDGGDCLTPGCTDPLALNYYELADTDDGTCFYGTCSTGTTDCMGNCVPENWIGENQCTEPSDNPLEHHLFGAYPNKLVSTVEVGVDPRGMCVLPNGTKAYIGCQSEVMVVNLLENTACPTTTSVPINGLALTCAASVNSARVFVSNQTTQSVDVISTATDVVIASIPVGDHPSKMWMSHNGMHVYVSCNFADQVYMINTATLAVVHIFQTGEQPRNICTSPDDSKLYVADWLGFTMSAFSTSPPYQLLATVPVDYWPQAIWASPDGKYVLVANFGFDYSYDHCSVIRTSDWQVIARLQTGAGPEDIVSIGESGQYVYVSNWGQPCCFATATDYCCSTTSHEGSATIIALPDFDAIVPQGTIPNPIPYLNYTLTTVPLEAQYSFGMATHPTGEFVYTVNLNSNNMSIIGYEETVITLAGETCANAIAIASLNDCEQGQTNCYHDDYNEACGFTETGAIDKVYSYTTTVNLHGSVDLCTSGFDTKLYIYEDECGAYNSGEALYCNDDYCGENGWRSFIDDIVLTNNHTYYFVVDGFGVEDKGDYELCFDFYCSSDLNEDGMISTADLAIMISGFGSIYQVSHLIDLLSDFGNACSP
jgi:YVTN family beta-propeller protein